MRTVPSEIGCTTRLCGLQIVEPGYKVFAVKPQFVKGIT